MASRSPVRCTTPVSARSGRRPRGGPVEGQVDLEHPRPVPEAPQPRQVAGGQQAGVDQAPEQGPGPGVGDHGAPGAHDGAAGGLDPGHPVALDHHPRDLAGGLDAPPRLGDGADEGVGQPARSSHRHRHAQLLGGHGEDERAGDAAGGVHRYVGVRGTGGQQHLGGRVDQAVGGQRLDWAQQDLRGGDQAVTAGPAGEGEPGPGRPHGSEHLAQEEGAHVTPPPVELEPGRAVALGTARQPGGGAVGVREHTAATSGDTAAATGAEKWAHATDRSSPSSLSTGEECSNP